jgi:hypothetical protein
MLAAQQETDEFLASVVPWDEDGKTTKAKESAPMSPEPIDSII